MIRMVLSLALVLASRAFAVVIPGDPADGEIRFDNSTVQTSAAVHRVGHRGAGATELTTSIYLFELPDLTAGDIYNASLQFSHLQRVGDFFLNPGSADLWGLGYVSSTTIDSNWHLLGDVDTRTGTDLGTGIGSNPVVKLSDDFLTNDSNDPGAGSYRQAFAGAKLSEFLTLLYTEGAVAGDYAVIRINFDANSTTAERGFDLASADAVDVATRPLLSINENQVLLYDQFSDGDRTNGADPHDTDWYTTAAGISLTVQDDAAGIGAGNALFVDMSTNNRTSLGSFPRVTLPDPGDFVQLTCTFRPVIAQGSDEAFRFGILGSGGDPVMGDQANPGDPFSYEGYLARMSTAFSTDLSTVGKPVGSFLGGSTDFLARNSAAFTVVAPDVHTLVYTITRAASDQMTTRIELSKSGAAAVVNGMDPGVDLDPPDLAFYDTFDTIGMGAGNSSEEIDFFLDEVLVETNVTKVQEHVETVSNVMELEVNTVSGIGYGFQDSTGLATPAWSENDYLLTGNGALRRLFDPGPLPPVNFYRVTGQAPAVEIFTEDLSAFNAEADSDFGDGTSYGVVATSTLPPNCPFGTGNALRVFDLFNADRAEAQGDLASPIFDPFLISFRACNESVSAFSFPSIVWRMGNFGTDQVSSARSAFALGWHADLTFSASYLVPPSSISPLKSPPLSAGIHEFTIVGNGSTTQTFDYVLFGETRTLDALAYDVYIDGVLFNSAPQFDGGLGFSVGAAVNYDSSLGLQRFGLLSSSTSDTDPDVWFDDIFLSSPWTSGIPAITNIAPAQTEAFSFPSAGGTSYSLQHTSSPSNPFSVWQDAGLEVLGDGGTELLFDPDGYDAAMDYRVLEKP